jgi:hypothetical protein
MLSTAAQGEATRENIEQEGCAGLAIRRLPMSAREEQVVYTWLLRLSRDIPGNRLLDHSSSSLSLSLPPRLTKSGLVGFASRKRRLIEIRAFMIKMAITLEAKSTWRRVELILNSRGQEVLGYTLTERSQGS